MLASKNITQTLNTFLVATTIFLLNPLSIAKENADTSGSKTAPLVTGSVTLFNQANQRPVKLNLWYRQGDCHDQSDNNLCLNQQVSGNKVAFLSHGAMGSSKDYNWLAYPLAAQGWIVVGLNHFGESWAYGPENTDPTAVVRLWQRAEDSSFVIDTLVKNNPFNRKVDWQNIVFIGHSSGGQTAASLAGVELSLAQMGSYCDSDKSANDQGCKYVDETKLNILANSPAYEASFKDKRIKAVIMLDPAIGPAATKLSLNNVSVPALVVGAKNNDFLPFEHHAAYYAKHMPNAKLVTLDNNEGHFVFLDECKHQYKANGISLCEDREGVNRKQVHQKLLGLIFPFISTLY